MWQGGASVPLVEIVNAHPLKDGENIRSVLLSKSESSSRHLVQIRGRESPHIHAQHDFVVILVRGQGVLHVGGGRQTMLEGSIAVIDRGTPHWFENTGRAPAAAFVVFSPPYDGTDNVPR